MTTSSALSEGLDLLGDEWTLLICQSVFLKKRRYGELKARLGMSDAVLADRLRTLTGTGVLARHPYREGGRTRHEYRLTDSGLALWSLLVAMWAWEREHVPGRSAELPELHHLDCSAPTLPTLGCGTCGRAVTVHDVRTLRAEPAEPIGRSTPQRRHRSKSRQRVAVDPLAFFPETMELLGERWATAILASAFLGVRHFSDLERELGIRPSVLSDRLARMTAIGVLETVPATTRSDAVAYRLTAKGRAFFPVIALLVDWSDRWLGEGLPPRIRLDHVTCDGPLVPVLRCDHCGKVLERARVGFDPVDDGSR